MTIGSVSATLTGHEQWSDSMAIWGKFNVSISGIEGDTVQVVRSIDGGTVWKVVKEYTANEEESGEEVERGWIYKIGIDTDDWVAGTAILVRLSF